MSPSDVTDKTSQEQDAEEIPQNDKTTDEDKRSELGEDVSVPDKSSDTQTQQETLPVEDSLLKQGLKDK